MRRCPSYAPPLPPSPPYVCVILASRYCTCVACSPDHFRAQIEEHSKKIAYRRRSHATLAHIMSLAFSMLASGYSPAATVQRPTCSVESVVTMSYKRSLAVVMGPTPFDPEDGRSVASLERDAGILFKMMDTNRDELISRDEVRRVCLLILLLLLSPPPWPCLPPALTLPGSIISSASSQLS